MKNEITGEAGILPEVADYPEELMLLAHYQQSCCRKIYGEELTHCRS